MQMFACLALGALLGKSAAGTLDKLGFMLGTRTWPPFCCSRIPAFTNGIKRFAPLQTRKPSGTSPRET